MSHMTNEERARYIKALLEERAMVGKAGKHERVEAIDGELERVGHKAAAPVRRAETRERKRPTALNDHRRDEKGSDR